jgi:hypothetical protein
MLNAIWEALKVVIEDYVFAAEASGKTGAEKKAEVVTALDGVVDAAATQYKLASIVVSIIKFFIPIVVDAVVAKLNAEGKLNPSSTSSTTATTTAS